mmetsp:Transcript_22207/g.66748  ORF Transcript_22207/g.66748 Transcript_22207/m.66748 type:complete len:124 (+) Transcript_22207:588-959(+)
MGWGTVTASGVTHPAVETRPPMGGSRRVVLGLPLITPRLARPGFGLLVPGLAAGSEDRRGATGLVSGELTFLEMDLRQIEVVDGEVPPVADPPSAAEAATGAVDAALCSFEVRYTCRSSRTMR